MITKNSIDKELQWDDQLDMGAYLSSDGVLPVELVII